MQRNYNSSPKYKICSFSWNPFPSSFLQKFLFNIFLFRKTNFFSWFTWYGWLQNWQLFYHSTTGIRWSVHIHLPNALKWGFDSIWCEDGFDRCILCSWIPFLRRSIWWKWHANQIRWILWLLLVLLCRYPCTKIFLFCCLFLLWKEQTHFLCFHRFGWFFRNRVHYLSLSMRSFCLFCSEMTLRICKEIYKIQSKSIPSTFSYPFFILMKIFKCLKNWWILLNSNKKKYSKEKEAPLMLFLWFFFEEREESEETKNRKKRKWKGSL